MHPTRLPARFVIIDRDTPLLLPPNLRDWVPADHRVHFILDAVDLVATGFFSAATGTTVSTAVAKTGHHRSVADLEKKPEPTPPTGQALYQLRQQTVEPVFGIIKSVLGFRQFRLRGRAKVALEWTLVCLAYNLKRLHQLGAATAQTRSGVEGSPGRTPGRRNWIQRSWPTTVLPATKHAAAAP